MADSKNEKKGKDKGKQPEAAAAEPKKHQPGVVSDRRVVTRPMKRHEVRDKAANLEESNPNAPKPIPTNEYRPRLVQIKRRHKTEGPVRPTPSGMSDIKI